MRSLRVVDVDGFPDHCPCLPQIAGAAQHQFILQGSVHPLCQCVLVAVVSIGHRAPDVVLLMQGLIQRRAILDSTVRVVDQHLITSTLLQCLPERDGHGLSMQALVHVMANDLAGERIGDQAQIEWAVLAGQVSDIGDPDMLGRSRSNLARTGFEQIGVAVKTVKAVGRLVIRTPRQHQ